MEYGRQAGRLFRATKNAAADWFAADISGLGHGERDGGPVRITLGMVVSGPTQVNLLIKENAVTDTRLLNRGDTLVSGALFVFEFILFTGQTFNVQHVTGAGLVVSCDVAESRDLVIA